MAKVRSQGHPPPTLNETGSSSRCAWRRAAPPAAQWPSASRSRACARASLAVSLTGSTANAKPFSPRESQRRAAASREAVCSGSFPLCGLGLKCYILIISSWFGCRNLRTKYDYNENPLLQSGKLHKFSYTHFERD